ncbi:hypothetical protein NIES970_22010 [[Synechococcus] sp. NIES-970]|nr:hypothetical protein NIES970_22010 [[Synechococcus] sp. NIES-970]
MIYLNNLRNYFNLSKKTEDIDFWVAKPNFNKAIEYLKLSQKSSAKLELIIAQLSSLFCVVDGTTEIFKNALHYEDFETGFEIECLFLLNADAIVTQNPEKYSYKDQKQLLVWSVDDLISRYLLNKSFAVEYRFQENKYHQLSIQSIEYERLLKYKIRNTISIVMDALTILKSYGYCGVGFDDFKTRLYKSENTVRSIISDLEHFNLAYRDRSNSRIYANKNLLDTGKKDIAEYISSLLKKHLVVQEIYKYIEEKKYITSSRVEEIIKQVFSCENISNKTQKDYRTRFISWLKFAELLENRQKNFYFIPSQEYSNKYQSHFYQQLELPLLVV